MGFGLFLWVIGLIYATVRVWRTEGQWKRYCRIANNALFILLFYTFGFWLAMIRLEYTEQTQVGSGFTFGLILTAPILFFIACFWLRYVARRKSDELIEAGHLDDHDIPENYQEKYKNKRI